MVTPTVNITCIKDYLKVETKPIDESLTYQGVFVDDLADFNSNGHKAVCYTARKTWGVDKGANVSSITESIITIDIHATKYYEYVGCSIETNIMEWSRIKHFKYLI